MKPAAGQFAGTSANPPPGGSILDPSRSFQLRAALGLQPATSRPHGSGSAALVVVQVARPRPRGLGFALPEVGGVSAGGDPVGAGGGRALLGLRRGAGLRGCVTGSWAWPRKTETASAFCVRNPAPSRLESAPETYGGRYSFAFFVLYRPRLFVLKGSFQHPQSEMALPKIGISWTQALFLLCCCLLSEGTENVLLSVQRRKNDKCEVKVC